MGTATTNFLERVKGGEYSLLETIDFRIMEMCPDEGTSLNDLYRIGTSVKEMSKKFDVPSSIVTPRVRILKYAELIVDIHMLGNLGGRAWQVTPKGKEALAKWKQSK